MTDTGIGIPPAQLETIFDRFAQVDASATRKHEGTGIGLSLVRELVELHGGRVWAESEGEGRGTEMHVILPIGEADAAEDEVMLQPSDGRALTAAGSFEAMASEISAEVEGAGDGASPRWSAPSSAGRERGRSRPAMRLGRRIRRERPRS